MEIMQIMACIGFGGIMALFFIGFGMALQRKIDGEDSENKESLGIGDERSGRDG